MTAYNQRLHFLPDVAIIKHLALTFSKRSRKQTTFTCCFAEKQSTSQPERLRGVMTEFVAVV